MENREIKEKIEDIIEHTDDYLSTFEAFDYMVKALRELAEELEE